MLGARSLFRYAVRSHLAGALWCGVGGGVAMAITAFSLQREFEQFPGGAAALGAMVTPAAEAMRIVRWPAERLDTLGGYLTYHNVQLVPLLLGIYSAVQGAQALRGSEEKHVLDLWLATGHPRWRVVVDRTAAFCVALAVAALGIGAGTAVGMSFGGDAQTAASLSVAAESALAALVFYGLALVLSSVFVASGAAAGVTVLVMTALYVATNVWELIGPFGVIRFVSPFWLRQRSDMLVPGREFDLTATAALVVMAAVLLALGVLAFTRRDYGRSTVARRTVDVAQPHAGTLAWRPSIAVASLFEQRLGIAAWAIGTGTFMAIFASLVPRVEDVWEQFAFYRQLFMPSTNVDVATEIVGYSGEVLAPALAAFAIVQSARWVRERSDGRDELVLSHPIGRVRYVVERLAVVALAAGAIVGAALLGLSIGGAAVGLRLDGSGLARLAVDLLLLTVSVGAASLALVALLRGISATAILTAWIVAAYLVVLFARVLDWPAWTVRLSIFDAFGDPYVAAPETYGIVTLIATIVAGTAIAIAALERRRVA